MMKLKCKKKEIKTKLRFNMLLIFEFLPQEFNELISGFKLNTKMGATGSEQL